MGRESFCATAYYRSSKLLFGVLAIFLLVIALVTAGCGGGGSSTATPIQPPPAGTQFSTNPPTTAAEGVQYAYTMAATDSAGGAVSFALTTGPTGAALSGNTLTWTPTQAQSRTSNSFMVRATNASGGTATQSWTVTPTGVVRGTRINTFVTENGDVLQPDDMTRLTVAAHVPNGSGTYTTLAGVGGTDGTVSIAGVPAGYFWLQNDQNFIWTNASTVDMGYAKLGRPDLVFRTSPTWITFDLNGFSAWQNGDAFEWYVANTNAAVLNTNNFTVGAMTLNYVDLIERWSQYLTDAVKGDRAYAGQLVAEVHSGKSIQVLSKILGSLEVTVADGGTATITGTMTNVTKSSFLRANFRSSAFSQYRASVNPQAVNDSTYVLLGTLPGGSARGLVGYPAYLLTHLNANGPLVNDADLGDIAYGNPFPATWAPVLQYAHYFTLQYTAPGATNPIAAYPLVYVATTTLPTVTDALQPLIGPAALPQINGRDFFLNQTAVGQTPTISWQAPSAGTPTGYGITLYRLSPNGADSKVEVLAYLWTDSNSVTLPPNLMSPGNTYTYLFRLRSFYDPGMDLKTAPYRQSFPYAYADAFSGTVNP
jgi:hypothetical protein